MLWMRMIIVSGIIDRLDRVVYISILYCTAPLHIAARWNRTDAIQQMLGQDSAKQDYNQRNRSLKTPRQVAMEHGHTASAALFPVLALRSKFKAAGRLAQNL